VDDGRQTGGRFPEIDWPDWAGDWIVLRYRLIGFSALLIALLATNHAVAQDGFMIVDGQVIEVFDGQAIVVAAVEDLAEPTEVIHLVQNVFEQPVDVSPFVEDLTLQFGGGQVVQAGSPFGEEPTETENLTPLEKLVERHSAIEAELVRLNLQPKAADDNKRVYVVPEAPFFGQMWYVDNGQQKQFRYFVVQLNFANTTDKPVTLKRAGIKFTADDDTYGVAEMNPQLRGQYYSVGNKSGNLGSLQMPEAVTIPAGGVADTVLVFSELPMGNDVPRMTLELPLGGEVQKVDLNRFGRAQLKLSTRRLGPHDCLGLLTIGGKIDAIGAGSLIEEMDRLSADRVARVVVEWAEDAPAVGDGNLMNWLVQSANISGTSAAGRDNQGYQFPDVPVSIRELHIGRVSKDDSGYVNNGPRIHKTTGEAVTAALRTAYSSLPVSELLDAIRSKDPLARAAAIEGGGDRLPADRLPVLIELTRGDDADLRRAATTALAHYGEDAAVGRLVELARGGDEQLGPLAIEGLATSRFAAAQDALIGLLKESDAKTRQAVVAVLARHPAPAWSDAIYEFARDFNTDTGRAALQALVSLGHPELDELLARALREGEPVTKNLAFRLLADRPDGRSEELALEYALDWLRKSPPNSTVQQVIQRTKDPRAVPLLSRHLLGQANNRSVMIDLMASIGGDGTEELLVKVYPRLSDNEKAHVLNALRRLQSPRFRELAVAAMQSEDYSLLQSAAQGLQEDGGKEAERVLIAALKQDKHQNAWHIAASALGNIGTESAQAALEEIQRTATGNKRSYAANALQNLRQRSPAYQYIYQGQHYASNQQWDDAVGYYAVAVQLDPKLIEGYAGRGEAYVRLKKYKEAKADFTKVQKLDPKSPVGAYGLAMLSVLEGDVEAGLKSLEKAEDLVTENTSETGTHLFNFARVYALAAAELQARKAKPDPPADIAERIEKAQGKAVALLRDAVKAGLPDSNRISEEPDLKAIRDTEAFKKMLKDMESATAMHGGHRRVNFRGGGGFFMIGDMLGE
jgi:HEAT repeat protein